MTTHDRPYNDRRNWNRDAEQSPAPRNPDSRNSGSCPTTRRQLADALDGERRQRALDADAHEAEVRRLSAEILRLERRIAELELEIFHVRGSQNH